MIASRRERQPTKVKDTVNRTTETDVLIAADRISLEGSLCVPDGATSIVLFVHGSGSSRHSSRNRFVVETLRSAGMGTLLFDLLTHQEEIFDQRTATLRFDTDLLAKRLIAATAWTKRNAGTSALRIGYFGASTGAAAALVAAATLRNSIGAIVSRGGRPDLTGKALNQVHTPTLLIVGGHDHPVLELNRKAQAKMHHAKTELVIIPHATHLFQEPGALEEVARIAASWFRRYLSPLDLSAQTAQSEVEYELE